MKSTMNLMAGVGMLMMAAVGENKGGAGLSEQLQQDAIANSPRNFHDHVYKALISGMSDEQIKAAIESAKDTLKARWEAEGTSPWPGIEAFEEHELEAANFRRLIESLGDDE